jgi:hypothetical protein
MGRRGRGVLVAALAAAALAGATPRAAAAEGLTLAARVPVAAPFGYTSHAGAGFAPSLNLQLGSDVAVGITSGILWYHGDDRWQKEIPALVGATFRLPQTSAYQPYLELRTGYTYAIGAEKSPHWLTLMAGLGVLVPVPHGLSLDLGFDVISPDLRGNAPDAVGLLFKLGVVHELL